MSYKNRNFFQITIFLLISGSEYTRSMFITSVSVPDNIDPYVNKTIRLVCNYKVFTDETLPVVTWSKAGQELGNCSLEAVRDHGPNLEPSARWGPSGIRGALRSRVTACTRDQFVLELHEMDIYVDDVFRCSLKKNQYKAAYEERKLNVYVPPDALEISGVVHEYGANERVEVQCTAPRSYPIVRLQWFANEKAIPETLIESQVQDDPDEKGFMPLHSTLRFASGQPPFVQSEIRIKCVAQARAGRRIVSTTVKQRLSDKNAKLAAAAHNDSRDSGTGSGIVMASNKSTMTVKLQPTHTFLIIALLNLALSSIL